MSSAKCGLEAVSSLAAALLRKSLKEQPELEPAGAATNSLELACVSRVHYQTGACKDEK